MDPVIILVVIVLGFLFLGYLISRKQDSSRNLIEVIQMLQNGSQRDRESLNLRLDSTARVIADLQRNLGEMSEIGRNMRDFQQFLSSPKLRGNIGEHILKELLLQSLPQGSFHLQYAFRSGEKVDAAVKTAAGLIPIDSKFPMENFRKMMSEESAEEKKVFSKSFEKDVKMHIDAISRKYILTDEGTIDYALMYIPSEAVYYEVVNTPSLFDYASQRRVLPVSPTTFYAYLKAILMSFEGQKVEERAKEILIAIKAIQKDYSKVEENINILQKHLTNAHNMLLNVTTSFSQLGQKISSTQSLGKKESKELAE